MKQEYEIGELIEPVSERSKIKYGVGLVLTKEKFLNAHFVRNEIILKERIRYTICWSNLKKEEHVQYIFSNVGMRTKKKEIKDPSILEHTKKCAEVIDKTNTLVNQSLERIRKTQQLLQELKRQEI